jgi:hypothetical protein
MNRLTNIFTPIVQRRLEGLALLLSSVILYEHLQFSWTVFAMYYFLPDLPIPLYVKGPKFGGIVYNMVHTLLLPLLIGLFGVVLDYPVAQQAALIWASHIAFDRAIGWGLKYEDSFCNTDLGVRKLPFSWSILE